MGFVLIRRFGYPGWRNVGRAVKARPQGSLGAYQFRWRNSVAETQ